MIRTCPTRWVGREVWELLGWAELWGRGLPPAAGGGLDQARWFVDAARRVMNEQDGWQERLRLTHGG